MRKICVVLVVMLVCAPLAFAQIYSGKADEMVADMDRTAAQSLEYYANVAIPGAEEDAKDQDTRYQEALDPMNQANEKHFQEAVNRVTVLDSDKQ